jgi:hypothetical protein
MHKKASVSFPFRVARKDDWIDSSLGAVWDIETPPELVH